MQSRSYSFESRSNELSVAQNEMHERLQHCFHQRVIIFLVIFSLIFSKLVSFLFLTKTTEFAVDGDCRMKEKGI